jgi:sulfofructose kinase
VAEDARRPGLRWIALWIAGNAFVQTQANSVFPHLQAVGENVDPGKSGIFVSADDFAADLPHLDLACVSYTAAARVLRLNHYPQWNEGAEIHSEDSSLAGDGPLVAGFAAGLGLSVGLETNTVAADEAGGEIVAFLDRREIAHTVAQTAMQTPRAYILTHPDGAREWLVDLRHAPADLAALEGTLIRRAQLVYIDCFASIGAGAARALEVARKHGLAVHANLGTLNLGAALERELRSAALSFVQASLPEDDASSAPDVARDLARQFTAVVYVTLGSQGAVAVEGDECAIAPARAVEVDYTHGAGAAFSAGAIYGRSRGWPLSRTLEFACAIGSIQCTAYRPEAPTERDVAEFIETTEPGPSVVFSGRER